MRKVALDVDKNRAILVCMTDELKPYTLNIGITDETGTTAFVFNLPVLKGDVTPAGAAFPTIEKLAAFLAGMPDTKEPITKSDMLLLGMVRQHLQYTDRGFDAGFIRVNAEALCHLCEIGLLSPAPGSENWDHFYRVFQALELDPPASSLY